MLTLVAFHNVCPQFSNIEKNSIFHEFKIGKIWVKIHYKNKNLDFNNANIFIIEQFITTIVCMVIGCYFYHMI